MRRKEKELLENNAVEVYGARVHNLKGINVRIPHNKLTVITGLSGSGKSSLAFDTIYAEGQRRYIETFSAYARNMLGNLERPDVDKITGLSPVISIEQKTINKNPRSTIGTITEIYDFFRLLYSRIGIAKSYISGKELIKYTQDQIVDMISTRYDGRRLYILAPIVNNRKGHYKELFETLLRKGYIFVRIDGELTELHYGMKLDRYKNHTIELVIDRFKADSKDIERLYKSVEKALKQGKKQLIVLDIELNKTDYYSQLLMDPENGISYSEPSPHSFSFNSPQGACPKCRGLGCVTSIDLDKVIPDKNKSIYEGGIMPIGKWRESLIFWQIQAICQMHGADIKTPIKDLSSEIINDIMNGTSSRLRIDNSTLSLSRIDGIYDGLIKYLEVQQDQDAGAEANKWSNQFYSVSVCPECRGSRLKKESLYFFIDNKNIAEVSMMEIDELSEWLDGLQERIGERQKLIAEEILKEIKTRINFLKNVGLGYLSLNRPSSTLSGGESQRIRLATQIGSQLVNVLYILDEPSIGLHQRDNIRLINSLKELRDVGNSVIVVEHDKDIMKQADWIIDIGPGAGRFGGNLMYEGTPKNMFNSNTLTAQYISGRKKIEYDKNRRRGNGKFIKLYGASGNNLKSVDLTIPLGCFVCVTGVSGSGKSSLINGTLQPIISKHFYSSNNLPLEYSSVEGIENVDKIITVDQSPIGKSPRSNPATYTGVFSDIRSLFVSLPDAKIRGYKPGRFSFNVKGGRCEVCSGNGYQTIEMNFLPDVLVKCPECNGKRYNRETLEVRFKGKSIADVLNMTVNQAVEFFENVPNILKKIKVLQDIGLGYVKLGQPSSTLSGGENQRVKLATELAKKDTGKTLFILDEPTTGLHFEDIRILLNVINKLVEKGNTIIVIEHNMDIIKCADWIIDMGPDGGRFGGEIVGEGIPEDIVHNSKSKTAQVLKLELGV